MYVTKAECDRYDDRELIRRSMEQVAYFACIYERYEAQLIRYIRRLGNVSREEAEDILQEAFIKVWNHLGSFDPRLQFSSWLFRILHNQTISYLRKQHTSGRKQTIYDESHHSVIADAPPSSEESLPVQEEGVHRILDRMGLKYKEVLVLKFLENMSYQEISDILKLPEGTVATRINRAKKEFRRLVNEQSDLPQ